MKSFICLAVSCVLVGLLYVYVRQQFTAQNAQIAKLSEIVRTLAQEMTRPKEGPECCAPLATGHEGFYGGGLPEKEADDLSSHREVVSDDESDVEDEDSDDNDSEIEDGSILEVKEEEHVEAIDFSVPENSRVVEMVECEQVVCPEVFEIVKHDAPALVLETPVSLGEITEVVLNSDEPLLAKTVQITTENYADWPLKRLKEKVAEMKGPATLKTKKAILEFLEQNIS
jgi:hypothetical protein